MDIQDLLARAQEIEAAIASTTAQLAALQGHKAEVAHWISQLPPDAPVDETLVEPPVETVVE